MTGGLDALENIGKKTVAVLTEGDPGESHRVARDAHKHNYVHT